MIFLFLGSGLTGYYLYEESVTKAAIHSFEQGEELAIEGDLKAAQQKFKEAKQKRSRFPAAETNENMVSTAMKVNDTLSKANKARRNDNFTEAMELVNNAEQNSAPYDGPLFTTIQEEIVSARTTVMVSELKFDMKGKESIDDLKPVLTRAETLQVDEAQEVAGQIRNQIVDFSINEANNYLKENHFSKALNSVEEGLQINKENEKLMNLKTVIEKRRTAFEEEQQKRIEHAMVAAAKEEEMNQTSAIELNDLKTTVTDYNELKVTGSVKSKATVPVNSIGASYRVLDADGKQFDKGEVYINPDELYPDDTGTFDFMIYDVGKDEKNLDQFTVEVDHFTWYLN
ncbi:hypothetical protein Q9251_00080 [Alkalihalobacillus macyae]|uniref:hypothetical protein n=1 Tax=Guptibacillus hwajinpoensis TaxID=208199 RepID=UPI00273C4E14|nr:hypothetical protein [Alkalihalobacillus macyae]MDP4549270.1 hypothetical protein [Alkalihalobacillus macyae]